MAVILEVKVGPMTGEKIAVRTGETKTFGRVAARANFALPHDTVMSGLHFAVECGPQGPFLKDHNSTNGTFLNGARVKDSPLANGDEIRSGQTIFSVKLIADEKLGQGPVATSSQPQPQPQSAPVVPASRQAAPSPEPARSVSAPQAPQAPPAMQPEIRATARPQEVPVAPPPVQAPPRPPIPPAAQSEAPRSSPPSPPSSPQPAQRAAETPRAAASVVALSGKPPVFTVGSWGFSVVPQGWTIKSEFGMEQAVKDGFPSSVTATEEMIGGNAVLGPFVESQLSMLRQYLKAPRIEATIPPAIPGAEEKTSVDVRYATNDGQTIFYRRLYARTGNTVGTLTLMTLDSEFASIRPAFDAIVGGIAFQVKPSA